MRILYLVLVLSVLLGGCSHHRPTMVGGKTTPYRVLCNVPGAKVLTPSGNIAGSVPLEGQLRWEGIDSVYSPYGEMVKIETKSRGSLLGSVVYKDYYFVGKIVAPGYQTKYFKEKLGWYRKHTDTTRSSLVDNVLINLYLDKTASSIPQQQQQQQQQQQTVIIPSTGTSSDSCVRECKKMFLKGELKTPIEECYKMLCD